MEAHEACLVGGTVGHWLAPTVEMAARVSGDWLRSDFAAMRWASFPGSGARTPGLSASRLCSAREFTMRTLRQWRVGERRDDIVIVVSELLTNALLHALPADLPTSLEIPMANKLDPFERARVALAATRKFLQSQKAAK